MTEIPKDYLESRIGELEEEFEWAKNELVDIISTIDGIPELSLSEMTIEEGVKRDDALTHVYTIVENVVDQINKTLNG